MWPLQICDSSRTNCANHFNPLVRFQVALAAKPVFHRRLQAIERNTVPRFQQSIAHRQRVIEDRVIREVAHGEVVDPLHRTRLPLSGRIDLQNRKSPGKHELTLRCAAVNL
jgi:hypothetical protein